MAYHRSIEMNVSVRTDTVTETVCKINMYACETLFTFRFIQSCWPSTSRRRWSILWLTSSPPPLLLRSPNFVSLNSFACGILPFCFYNVTIILLLTKITRYSFTFVVLLVSRKQEGGRCYKKFYI